MPKDIFFSVILPTYNRAHMLATAIKSVLDQTFGNWELLIIDDGSTDNTKDIVENFVDPRMRYEFKEHEERSVARNKGVKLAKGNYLCFLDSDDWFLPNHLQSHYETYLKNGFPAAAVYSGTYIEQKGERITYPHLFDGDDPIKRLWEIGYNLLPFSFHHSMFKDLNFDADLNYMEDLDVLLKILAEKKIYSVKDFSNVVLQHDARSITKKFNKNLKANGTEDLRSLERIIFKHSTLLKQKLGKKSIQRKRRNLCFQFMKSTLKKGELPGFFYFFILWLRYVLNLQVRY